MPTGEPATSPYMSLTLFDLLRALKDHAEFWFYRIGGQLLINVLDDPAWLALMFC